MSRAVEIAGFLPKEWAGAEILSIPADFSSRRYARLRRDDGRSAILMDADPDQKTAEFVSLAWLLREMDLSAPEIYAADPERGFVLMEDFGGNNFGKLLESGRDAAPLYRRAVDVLVHLHRNFDRDAARVLDLPIFGGALFATQVEFFLDVYFPYIREREATREESESFRAAWKEVLKGIEALPQTLMLRDFMPDNLMDLPDRKDWRSTGLLDFQDAGLGPIAYDLASLCEEVRRDGGAALLDDMIAYYHHKAQPRISLPELRSACRILAAQRHMRILALLVRLEQKTGQREKLAFLPRIRGYLELLMQDAALAPVRTWMKSCC